MERIDFKLDEGFPFDKIPQPQFSVGETVFCVPYDGNRVVEDKIEEVVFKVIFHNNGFVNFAEYKINYSFNYSLHVSSTNYEIFKTRQEAEIYANIAMEKHEEFLNRQKQEKIKKLIKDLNRLINE